MNFVSEFQEIKWLNNMYIAVGNGRSVSTSPEGINWTLQNLPPPLYYTSNTLRGVAWSGSNYVVVGDAGMILTSPDAINWQDHTLPDMMPSFNSVAWGNGKFVAVATGNFPVGNDIIYTSPDGNTWQRSATSLPKATLAKVEWMGDKFVVAGTIVESELTRPLILTSTDGVAWSSQIFPKEQMGFNDVIRVGNKMVAIGTGANASISALSYDGLSWTINEFDKSIGIADLAYSGTTFVGVGNGIYTSIDAIHWTNQVPPNNLMYFYHAVEWSGFNYVATGGGNYQVWISP